MQDLRVSQSPEHEDSLLWEIGIHGFNLLIPTQLVCLQAFNVGWNILLAERHHLQGKASLDGQCWILANKQNDLGSE